MGWHGCCTSNRRGRHHTFDAGHNGSGRRIGELLRPGNHADDADHEQSIAVHIAGRLGDCSLAGFDEHQPDAQQHLPDLNRRDDAVNRNDAGRHVGCNHAGRDRNQQFTGKHGQSVGQHHLSTDYHNDPDHYTGYDSDDHPRNNSHDYTRNDSEHDSGNDAPDHSGNHSEYDARHVAHRGHRYLNHDRAAYDADRASTGPKDPASIKRELVSGSQPLVEH